MNSSVLKQIINNNQPIPKVLVFIEEEPVKNIEMKSLVLYPVGQAVGTYIIAENDDGMYLIDQHAAEERINYERIQKGF